MIGLQNILVCLLFGVLLSGWQRAFEVFVGHTLLSIAVFTGLSLVGSFLGCALAVGVFRRVRRLGRWPAVGFLFTALALSLQLLLIPRLTHDWQQFLLLTINRPYGIYVKMLLQTAAFFFLPLTLLLSAALQVNWHLYAREHDRSTDVFLPLMCTVSLVVLGGYGLLGWLLAAVPVEWLTDGAVVLLGLLAALSAVQSRSLRPAARLFWAGLCLVISCAPLFFLPPVRTNGVFVEGTFGRFANRDSGFSNGVAESSLLTRRHAFATYSDPDYLSIAALDGRPLVFKNRFHSMRTLAAYAPLLMRPNAGRVAIGGSEAGLFVPYFYHAGVTNVTVAYAEPALTKALIYASAASTNEAARLCSAVHDGAVARRGRYDIIYLAPDPAWLCGSGLLYGRHRLMAYKKALAPAGVVALHVDARGLTPECLAVIIRRFLEVFPAAQLWNVGLHDWELLGAEKRLTVSLEAASACFDREEVFADRVRAGNPAITEAFACMIAETEQLRAWLDTKKPLSAMASAWYAPQVLVARMKDWVAPSCFERYRSDQVDWILPGAMDRELYGDVLASITRAREARVVVIRALGEWMADRREECIEAAATAVKLLPRDVLLVQMIDRLELDARRRLSIGDYKGAEFSYLKLLLFRPDQSIFHYGLGLVYRHKQKPEAALQEFRAAVANSPAILRYRLALAEAAQVAGHYAESDQMFRDILNREPENVEAIFRYSQSLGSSLRGPSRPLKEAIKYGEYACKLTHFKNKEYAFGLANLYIEAGRVLEGVSIKRQFK